MSKRAAIVLAAILTIVFGLTASQAIATQGQPVIAGQANFETDQTVFFNTAAIDGCSVPGFFAVAACGGVYGQADGSDIAVEAKQVTAGGLAIRGEAKDGGTGVKGVTTGATGIGVHGQTPGTGSAVYGEATGSGVGVFGDTTNGIGVLARSTNGAALDVRGKAKFSSSGTIVIAAGTASRTVPLAGVTTASMVLVTSQQNAKVFVKAAVPGNGSFTIRLSGVAPAAGLKVAYFVLN